MTSRTAARQCFVFITLPGQTQSVTAAKYELSHRDGVSIGRLVYGRKYLERADAVEFDPVELRFGTTIEPTTKYNGLYGALRDASPDYWGRLIIERALDKPKLDEMDYLLNSADARAGALGFGHNNTPPTPDRIFNTILDLEELQETALAILDSDDHEKRTNDAKTEQARRLLLVGTAMGGARPKAVVEHENGLWIAKFNKDDDRWDSAKVEHAMLSLARACAIAVPQSQVVTVGRRNVLLVKRFDRKREGKDYLRARMISALTLLRSEDTMEARSKGEWSYLGFVEALRRVSADPKRDARELFKRMCFNAAASNLDDHARNHAIVAMEKEWRLSPAFDLTPSPQVGMERFLQMIAGDQGTRASAANLLSQSGRFLLKPDEAAKIVTEISATVRSKWFGIARAEQVTKGDCEVIRPAFENPGFDFASQLPKKKSRPATGHPQKTAGNARKAVTRKSRS